MSTKSQYALAAISILLVAANIRGADTSGDVLRHPPNIVLIMADDLGYGDVGFNGQRHIKTPHLDRMAREGMVLTNHYAGAPVCMPSRGSLLTGKHLGNATIRGNRKWTNSGTAVDLGPADVTFAEELKRVGYTTAIIGKWGMAEASDDGMPSRQGFDYFFGYRRHVDAHHYYWPTLWENEQTVELPANDHLNKKGEYVHDLLTHAALDFVGEHAETPFLLFLSYTIPHYELTVPEESKAPYQNLGWPERLMKPGHYRHDPEGNTAYAGMVSRMDTDIGRMLDRLGELGIDKNTLVIFTSDNGPEYERTDRFFNSNGPLRGGKRDLYEGGIRVPFVARWPGKIAAGKRSDHPSAFWDFLPTVCEIAGVSPQDAVDGLSYLPTLIEAPQGQARHPYLYWEFNERQGPIQAVRQNNWKAVMFQNRAIELYDLSSDISESIDLSTLYPGKARDLEGLINTARTEHPEFPLTNRSK